LHSLPPQESYSEQKEETKPFIEAFAKDRLPKLLGYLNRAVAFGSKPLTATAVSAAATPPTEAPAAAESVGPYLFGRSTPCYADFALAHALTRSRSQFPAAVEALSQGTTGGGEGSTGEGLAALEALEAALMQRERVAAYVASDRRAAFAEDSMM